ncbi:MAG TPA: hypothetical protein VNM40_00565 [Candidatus Paceibacterota bacterium]|nr:hypothetical protein [Candidatus Paceibacterota bacterium]
MRQFLARQQHIVVRGLLRVSGKVLVIPSEHASRQLEYYELPGGTVPFGDDPKDVLQDFFFQQTRIPITVLEPFCTMSHLSRYGDDHTVEIVYRVKAQAGVGSIKEDSVMWVQDGERGYFFSKRIADVIDLGGKNEVHVSSLWSRCKKWFESIIQKIKKVVSRS